MTTKGQSMTLSYWRGRSNEYEQKCKDLCVWIDTLEEYRNELGLNLSEARRLAGNQRSQKNYWKRKAVKKEKDLNHEKFKVTLLDATITNRTAKFEREIIYLSKLKNINTYISYSLIALWIIWS